ncbi:MAG: flagellar type III secretion system pore protein FliP [Planctomycetaceae bacterium]
MTNPTEIVERVTQSGGFEHMATPLQVALFLGAMVFLSAALVTMTSFTRIIIVLSFVRRALSTQEIPPNPVLMGLALFLSLFVMGPTFEAIGKNAVDPYLDGKLAGSEAVRIGTTELQKFMLHQTRKRDLALFINLANAGPIQTADEIPLRVLIPAFVISELKTAFIMGFCLYIPFLLVDLVISTVLMSLGMMMMPPVIISTPFKVLLFVLVDGWHLIARALSMSFG